MTVREEVLRRDRDCVLHRRAAGECWRNQLHVHHIVLRRHGHDDPDDLVAVCAVAHEWIHGHPLLAQCYGFLVPSWVDDDERRAVVPQLRDRFLAGAPVFAPWLSFAERIAAAEQNPLIADL